MMGHPGRQSHKEDVPNARPKTLRVFLCRIPRGGEGATLPVSAHGTPTRPRSRRNARTRLPQPRPLYGASSLAHPCLRRHHAGYHARHQGQVQRTAPHRTAHSGCPTSPTMTWGGFAPLETFRRLEGPLWSSRRGQGKLRPRRGSHTRPPSRTLLGRRLGRSPLTASKSTPRLRSTAQASTNVSRPFFRTSRPTASRRTRERSTRRTPAATNASKSALRPW
jgi:hypothetical protein